ncbi:MAG: SBBP repeat-containing protein [Candidatus Solibacter usitatus]|nr:SBBP repeat-containing protein [Candidatus Solibacter usitatus]
MNLPLCRAVEYAGLWPGIDLRLEGDDTGLKATIRVGPGGELADVQFAFDGAEVALSSTGGLRVRSQGGDWPLEVQGRDIRILAADRIGFTGGGVDGARELSVMLSPPVGNITNRVGATAADSHQARYLAGYVRGDNNDDAFVAKFDQRGEVLYLTYLGGAGSDRAHALYLQEGSVLVAGETASPDFPVGGGYATALRGPVDAFVAKLDGTEGGMNWGTYLGGTGEDAAFGVAADASGNVYVAGVTTSTDFPVAMPHQAMNHGNGDAFLTKFDASGGWILYSTYLGGDGTDRAEWLTVDGWGNAMVSGSTGSSSFPRAADAAGSEPYSVVLASGNGESSLLRPPKERHFSAWFTAHAAAAPSVVSVSPSTGSGALQVFAFAFSHAESYTNIARVNMNFHTTLSSASACYLEYDRAANTLQLAGNDGNGWAGSVSPGTPAVLENGQCLVDAAMSSAQGAGLNLTVSVALTLKPSFTGVRNIYAAALGSSGLFSGWSTLGVWTVPSNLPPETVSVTPSSGGGPRYNFGFVFRDPNGYGDLARVGVNFNTTLSSAGCYLEYTRAVNSLQLASADGASWMGSGAVGSPGALSNANCGVDLGASTVAGSGTDLVLTLAISFGAPFGADKNVYMSAADAAGSFSGWQQRGTWIVNAPPRVYYLAQTESAGSGPVPFWMTYSDTNGQSDIKRALININVAPVAANGCYIEYLQATNTLQLAGNDGMGWAGSAPLGAAVYLENGQCRVDVAAASASGSLGYLTLRVTVTFKAAFLGQKNIYGGAQDYFGSFSGWQAMGTWWANAPPRNQAVFPSTWLHEFQFTDLNGYADIARVDMNYNTTLQAAGGCYLEYLRSTNTLLLAGNDGTGWAGSVVIGSPGIVENGQCSVDASLSTVLGSSTTLQVFLRVTFKPNFSGQKTIYMAALDSAGNFSGWEAKGVWTTP